MYVNPHFVPLQNVKSLFELYLERLDSIEDQAEDPVAQELDVSLSNTNNAAFKILHPLFIKSYKSPNPRYREEPIKVIGLDIETNHLTGEPMLLGFNYPGNEYYALEKPTLNSFWQVVRDATDNSPYNFITWGNLDIQCLLRLFKPTENERSFISRGISGKIKNGEIVVRPPVLREIKLGVYFYVSHYIPGRSLKLGYLENGRERTVWIFNASQFYPGRIADTAKGLGLDWKDFGEETHLIDWARFDSDSSYHTACIKSNEQDARVVTELVDILQARFYEVFKAYPQLLVSTGSLTDAAVSKMTDKQDYQSNSWAWLAKNIWNKSGTKDIVSKAETILAECFSAGYVDQFAVGYFGDVCTADIAAAYPDKIRQLPDLRYSELFYGRDNLENDIVELKRRGYDIESAIIRGKIEIPDTLKYHPITVRTYNRENIRPVGIFYAGYTIEERNYCRAMGANFSSEEYIVIALTKRKEAPISRVSKELGEMRARLLEELANETNESTQKVLDGQQYLVKVIDNSIYGKTVMTVEEVEEIEGNPQITGYSAGDRFNLLYGTLITARTRVQIAKACNEIAANGGKPIMTMTDSIYWKGELADLPGELVRNIKTPGCFEAPEIVKEFFILKTGQYEYKGWNKKFQKWEWNYKLRGLPISYDYFKGEESFFHKILKEFCGSISPYTHPKDILIPLNTKRLMTIGGHNLDLLGAIIESESELAPFRMSSKQVERYLMDWKKCLTSYVWLQTQKIVSKADSYLAKVRPLSFLREVYEGAVTAAGLLLKEKRKTVQQIKNRRHDGLKRLYVWLATRATRLPPIPGRSYRQKWETLQKYYGMDRRVVIGQYRN